MLTHTISPTVWSVIAGHPVLSPSFPVISSQDGSFPRPLLQILLCGGVKTSHIVLTRAYMPGTWWQMETCTAGSGSTASIQTSALDAILLTASWETLRHSVYLSHTRTPDKGKSWGNRCALCKPLSTGCCFFGRLIPAAYTLPREAWFTGSRVLHSANVEFFLLCNTE